MKHIHINLGPYYLLLQGKKVGMADNLVLEVAQATPEDILAIKQATELLLQKYEGLESSRVQSS